jgi:hypothetical protein
MTNSMTQPLKCALSRSEAANMKIQTEGYQNVAAHRDTASIRANELCGQQPEALDPLFHTFVHDLVSHLRDKSNAIES